MGDRTRGDTTNDGSGGRFDRWTVLKRVGAAAAGFVGVPVVGVRAGVDGDNPLYEADVQDDPGDAPGGDPFGSPSDGVTTLYEVDLSGGNAIDGIDTFSDWLGGDAARTIIHPVVISPTIYVVVAELRVPEIRVVPEKVVRPPVPTVVYAAVGESVSYPALLTGRAP